MENEANKNSRNIGTKRILVLLVYSAAVLIFLFLAAMVYIGWSNNSSDAPSDGNAVNEISTEQNTATPEIITATPMITNEPIATPYVPSELPYGDPLEFGFSLDGLQAVDTYIQDQVDDGFPGAVLMVMKDDHIVFHEAYGYSLKYDGMVELSEFEPMQLGTMFDLASLSKIYATTFSIMKLVDDGLITLDGKVSEYLSDYMGGSKENITVQMLLSHNAGYVENYYFYNDENGYLTRDRSTVYEYVKSIPLDVSPGSVFDYNNLNYIILGMIVEEVSGMRIDEYARTNIYEPLGIADQVTYIPLDNGIEKSMIAASERQGNTRDNSIYFEGIREYTIQGEVHDENTFYCMDEVSGHAGLFATSYALTVLNNLLINGGEYQGVRIYKQETVDNWLVSINDKKYQLGLWDASIASEKLKSCVSNSTFYHNGWTGTATIVDLENNLSIILLTNKRHSPCPDGDFEGTEYSIAYYVSLIQKVYKAMDN